MKMRNWIDSNETDFFFKAYKKIQLRMEILREVFPTSSRSQIQFHQPVLDYHHRSTIRELIPHFANHLIGVIKNY